MTKELEDKLFNRFNFYKADASLMFGIECGNGWFDIIWELSEKIENILNKYYPTNQQALDLLIDCPVFGVKQVKEKFGTLRFYYEMRLDTPAAHDEIMNAVNEAEEKTYTTCEECGQPGEKTSSGWIKVLCDNCKKDEK